MSVESSTPVRCTSRAKNGDSDRPKPPNYSVGDRVVFESERRTGSGVIDDLMPDGSVVWVWSDDAMGRKMIFGADALSVRHEERPHEQHTRSN
ncbi:hypothetical protein M1D88_08010 [Arthrobacter sp. R1-13]